MLHEMTIADLLYAVEQTKPGAIKENAEFYCAIMGELDRRRLEQAFKFEGHSGQCPA